MACVAASLTHLKQKYADEQRPVPREVHEHRLEPFPEAVALSPSLQAPVLVRAPLPLVAPSEQLVVLGPAGLKLRKEVASASASAAADRSWRIAIAGAIISISVFVENDVFVGSDPQEDGAQSAHGHEHRKEELEVDTTDTQVYVCT